MRVLEVLQLPRARLLIRANGAQAGQVSHAGFLQSFEIHDGVGIAELPVALVSGDKNPIDITVVRAGKTLRSSARVRFRPRPMHQGSLVFMDPSCSNYQVRSRLESKGGPDNWMYIGCRMVHLEGAEHRTSSLELFVYWDHPGGAVQVDGLETPSSLASLWTLRLRSRPGKLTLKARDAGGSATSVALTYRIPDRLKWGSLGAGLGPYAYTYDAPGNKADHVTPLLTLYGSFFVSETMRLVAFDATAFSSSSYFTDLGVYFSNQSVLALDRRLAMNVMLGAHTMLFPVNGQATLKFGVPQGFEIIFKDALAKGKNLSAGAFIYPPIQGRSYYNAWLRWGSSMPFYELNYIAWQEPLGNDTRAYSRSAGISVGFILPSFY